MQQQLWYPLVLHPPYQHWIHFLVMKTHWGTNGKFIGFQTPSSGVPFEMTVCRSSLINCNWAGKLLLNDVNNFISEKKNPHRWTLTGVRWQIGARDWLTECGQYLTGEQCGSLISRTGSRPGMERITRRRYVRCKDYGFSLLNKDGHVRIDGLFWREREPGRASEWRQGRRILISLTTCTLIVMNHATTDHNHRKKKRVPASNRSFN